MSITPLPLSIISCLVGLLLLTDIRRAKLPILITILSLAFFLLSFFLSALLNNSSLQIAKLTLLAQFFIPLMGLVLGYSWVSRSQSSTEDSTVFQSATIVLLSFLIAAQLLATVFQKAHPLTPWMYFFSIYQHLQYVPVIVVGLFWWICIGLFDRQWVLRLSLTLTFFVSCYAMLAMSMQASILCGMGALSLLWLRGLNRNTILVLCLTISGLVMAFQLDGGAFKFISRMGDSQASEVRTMTWADKLGTIRSPPPLATDTTEPPQAPQQSSLPGLGQRFSFINLYLSKLIGDPKWLAFGSPYPLNRQLAPSAHNYFIDLLFNFELLGLIPIVMLLGLTINRLSNYSLHTKPCVGLYSLIAILLYFVLALSSLTVAIRQPYLGIVIFFLWGLLLARSDSRHVHR
jgi:hypothetical protein